MNLKDYIKAKYVTENPAIITKKEAMIFGVSYPLSKGWLEDYGHIVLTRKMILRLRAYFQVSHKGNIYSLNALTMLGGNLTDNESIELSNMT